MVQLTDPLLVGEFFGQFNEQIVFDRRQVFVGGYFGGNLDVESRRLITRRLLKLFFIYVTDTFS